MPARALLLMWLQLQRLHLQRAPLLLPLLVWLLLRPRMLFTLLPVSILRLLRVLATPLPCVLLLLRLRFLSTPLPVSMLRLLEVLVTPLH